MADAAVETAPNDENDDTWLYGESVTEQNEETAPNINDKEIQQPSTAEGVEQDTEEKEQDDNEGNNEDSHFNDEHFEDVDKDEQRQTNGDGDSQDNGDSDSDDSDDVKVTIGEIKSGPQAYASLNIKRGVGLVATGGEKPRSGPTTGGKVTLEDMDGPGSINGVPALEFNIDTIEDKPWNKPGADISDYFNYGFNEVTWSAYCERQRRMRVNEAGVGLHAPPRAPAPDLRRNTGSMRHDDGPPPMMQNNYQARENTIQVMTAERREYGRPGAAPGAGPRDAPDYFAPDHYYPPHASYEEPTWGPPEQTGWAPSEIKELTPGPAPPLGPPPAHPPPAHAPPAHAHLPPPHLMPAPFSPYRSHPPPLHPMDRDRDRDRDRERDRERDRDRMRERDDRDRRERDRRDDEEREHRDRDRERSRSIKPDRSREKSYRRERSRSRSRSRRHKSRSRSPRRDRSAKPKGKEPKDKDDDK